VYLRTSHFGKRAVKESWRTQKSKTRMPPRTPTRRSGSARLQAPRLGAQVFDHVDRVATTHDGRVVRSVAAGGAKAGSVARASAPHLLPERKSWDDDSECAAQNLAGQPVFGSSTATADCCEQPRCPCWPKGVARQPHRAWSHECFARPSLLQVLLAIPTFAVRLLSLRCGRAEVARCFPSPSRETHGLG